LIEHVQRWDLRAPDELSVAGRQASAAEDCGDSVLACKCCMHSPDDTPSVSRPHNDLSYNRVTGFTIGNESTRAL
jgi:hypothetical protein